MSAPRTLERRQIWAQPTTTTHPPPHCTAFNLPPNGVLVLDPTSTITLSQIATFQPQCNTIKTPNATTASGLEIDLRDPFYASTSPQMYAIATATVISYMLVIMLFITPRTFFIGGSGGGGFLGGRGLISGSSGSPSIIGVGGRPWLQKAAASTVSISLTIATVNTFKVAEAQYQAGFQDAITLTEDVVGSLEIRIIRVISTTFLWLAQVQTLIRLFPRHKEKVIIKWTGFALILLESIFSILNNFLNSGSKTRPRSFTDAIPALDYLFELALSLLYAAWVMYYSVEKRRFAYYHPKMGNIFMVALLSVIAIMVPVVFFVLDLSMPDVVGWGDYMRWVGAAAASVVVWEWVERIEALEREERKDGILGREIFDGDEMLDITPSTEVRWPGAGGDRPHRGGGNGATSTGRSGPNVTTHHNTKTRLPPPRSQQLREVNGAISHAPRRSVPRGNEQPSQTQPSDRPPIAPPSSGTPVSRADTTSAASTDYAVHYHPVSESTSPGFEGSSMPSLHPITSGTLLEFDETPHTSGTLIDFNDTRAARRHPPAADPEKTQINEIVTATEHFDSLPNAQTQSAIGLASIWRNVRHPFKRKTTPLPPEVFNASITTAAPQMQPQEKFGALDILRMRRNPRVAEPPLPVVVIPAQPRGTVWSPPPAPEDDAAGEVQRVKNPQLQNTSGEGSGITHASFTVPNAQHSTSPPQSNSSSPQTNPRPRPSPPMNPNDTIVSRHGSLTFLEERSSRAALSASPRATSAQRAVYPPSSSSAPHLNSNRSNPSPLSTMEVVGDEER